MRHLLPIDRGRRRAAFTILELLVSMAVLLVFVVVLGQMLSQSSAIWKQGEGNKERLQDLRAVTDFIAGELQSALLPINRTSVQNLEFTMNPPGASEFKNKDSLFWQSPLAVDQTLGDIACIGYFVRWDDSDSANPRSVLCRFYVDPVNESTGGSDPNFLIYSNPAAWLTASVLAGVAPATKAENYKGLFAENVIGLWINLIASDGSVMGASGSNWSSRTSSPVGRLPVAVDIGLVMVDSHAAKRITPALKGTISGLVTAAPDAATFVRDALENTSLNPVAPGFRAYQTRISLQNSK